MQFTVTAGHGSVAVVTATKAPGRGLRADLVPVAVGLPKTRSGKIMRRILRKIAVNKLDEVGDISTLAEPQVVDMLIATKGQ